MACFGNFTASKIRATAYDTERIQIQIFSAVVFRSLPLLCVSVSPLSVSVCLSACLCLCLCLSLSQSLSLPLSRKSPLSHLAQAFRALCEAPRRIICDYALTIDQAEAMQACPGNPVTGTWVSTSHQCSSNDPFVTLPLA